MPKTIRDLDIGLQSLEEKHTPVFLSQKCNGMMGVPITFLDKYNPEQFLIVGFWNAGTAGESIGATYANAISSGKKIIWNGPTVDGRTKYFRIIVRRKVTGHKMTIDERKITIADLCKNYRDDGDGGIP